MKKNLKKATVGRYFPGDSGALFEIDEKLEDSREIRENFKNVTYAVCCYLRSERNWFDQFL